MNIHNKNEKQFLEDNILKVILDNKEGLTIDTISEFWNV